ncbi:TetR/AcrR family transcriptional regulator [Xinfangfangia sp. D13-10-4-6]|uniref:TetR/AcrR family transcriptional regulator n=1 Tax=Pseudogemmobacter hezensis TaxID=2737662 RepID=UPI00155201E0|nr:TetR/AcrR family transcriptional regulator [Pseudogemmobacter hezensis]NPD16024.1 TetR/AcrR family transcriptional regulator [Pseudogemmobacter hezensis]
MSGRPRSIDRDKVLDAAESVVAESGAAGLSFGAVAKAAGITRGGVQYCFGTRENLIRAMVSRWGDTFEADVHEGLGPDPSPQAVIRGHIRANLAQVTADFARSAMMMTAILQSPDQVAETKAWYDARLSDLDPQNPQDRASAVAFLASEGIFYLKSFGLIGLPEATWKALAADIMRLAGASPDSLKDGDTPPADPS